MQDFMRTFLRRPAGSVGLLLLALVCLLAVLAPLLYPASPWEMVGIPFSRPGENDMLLGSDTLGRDVASGIAHGARVSILIGLASTLTALCIGVPLGCIAGYAGGAVDSAIVRLTEIFQTIPSLVLAILFVAILTPSIGTIILAIGLVSWPPLARLTRAQVKTVSQREFVQAARCQGQSTLSIVLRHVLPNAVSTHILAGSLSGAGPNRLPAATTLMGPRAPNFMSWGYMVGAGRTVIRQAWWLSVFPGIAILLTVVAINLVGEALNDTLNPRISRA